MVKGKPNHEITLGIQKPRVWSPEDPYLYGLQIRLVDSHTGQQIDAVTSYCAMRKVSLVRDAKGILRLGLNNAPIFHYGPLDQGFWPHGLYTPPTDDAMRFDIEVTQRMGFNMIRKHIKVEPARWYYYCDKLGVMVWQDMPSGGTQFNGVFAMLILNRKHVPMWGRKDPENQKQYFTELEEMITALYHFPSIMVWVPFNEGWGQFRTEDATALVRKVDPSRLINSASGWEDKHVGDMHDVHVYPGPGMPQLEETRAVVCGEFGGLGWEVRDHMWSVKSTFAYRKYKSKETLAVAYEKLVQQLKTLKERGLAGAVYTQTTDVEGEVNGVLTYDRAIAKMDVEWLAHLHKYVI